MSKKFSIVKAIDLNRLNNEIDVYMAKTGEMNPYIFMNVNTLESVAREFIPSIGFRTHGNVDGYTAKYKGYKIFANEDLDFGEVEIR